MKKERAKLRTEYAVTEIPFCDYPRPTMVRDSYMCLNGEWKLSTPEWEGSIVVPYPPEASLSGVGRHLGGRLVYEREFELPSGFLKDRVILHFGAVDQIATVYINGVELITHVGGYTSFSCDVTDCLKASNTLKVEVTDDLKSRILPYGKQSERSKGMWYTQVTGIWQTVWLESVPEVYVKSLDVKVSDKVEIVAEGISTGKITLTTPDGERVYGITDGKCEFNLQDPRKWSPECPYLYRYTVESGEDRVESYFAVRDISVVETAVGKRIALNAKPYFMHGILDQGYFSDGLFLPASTDAYMDEINRLKALGFNMLRKHVKIEPEIFYSLCDRLGIVVFQDMVNNGKYSFFRDTLLPNIGLARKKDKNAHKCKRARDAFLSSMRDTVIQLKKHPCICYWTIFNEGWGQFSADEAYRTLKELDTTRLIDATSGWFEQSLSDVRSIHSYFFEPRIDATSRPVVLSEFGGATFKVNGHTASIKDYGYGSCKTREQFVSRVREKYERIIDFKKKGLSASVYTQVSDIEDEINGLITYDRMIQKINPEELIDLSRELTREE